MDKNYLLRHWYADIYEQQVIQDNEVKFILATVGDLPKNILEVACGGGRITVPMAKAGHTVTGFDFDEYMLEKIPEKAKGIVLTYYKADAISDNWGKDFDVVILAGNILLNIESGLDYHVAQELFIKKASQCVKVGGHLYLDFDCYNRSDQKPNKQSEWVCFDGTDDLGTYGKYIVICGEYDSQTQTDKSYRRYEITPKNNDMFSEVRTSIKHFPKFHQVKNWLDKYGWEIEWLYGGYEKQAFDENIIGNRAIIWAKKK